jgi:excisionase family DNA binding protein
MTPRSPDKTRGNDVNPLDIFPNAKSADGDTAAAPKPTPLVLTVEAAAERLGIGRSLMYALVKTGDVESVCIGRLRRTPVDALETFVRSLRKPTGDQAA